MLKWFVSKYYVYKFWIQDWWSGRPTCTNEDKGLRSTKWPTVRNHFLKVNPLCAYCGCSKNIQIHHIQPFHLHPEDELKPSNFVPLCENEPTLCHLNIGHKGYWHDFNPNVLEDCKKHNPNFKGCVIPKDLED